MATERYEKIIKTLDDIFHKHNMYDAMGELSGVYSYVREALRNLELVVKYSRDPRQLLGDFIGAIVNAYFRVAMMLSNVEHSTVSEAVKESVRRYVGELNSAIWDIVREYLKTLR
jgi:hypothetical protein